MNISDLAKLIRNQIESLLESHDHANEYEVRFGKFETNDKNGKTYFNTNLTEHNTDKIAKALHDRFWPEVTEQTVTDYNYNGARIRVDSNNNVLEVIRKENLERTDIVILDHPIDLRLNLAIEKKVNLDIDLSKLKRTKRTKKQLVFHRTLFNLEFTKTHYHGEDYFQEELEVKNIKINRAAESHLAEDITDEIIFILNAVKHLDINSTKLKIR